MLLIRHVDILVWNWVFRYRDSVVSALYSVSSVESETVFVSLYFPRLLSLFIADRSSW